MFIDLNSSFVHSNNAKVFKGAMWNPDISENSFAYKNKQNQENIIAKENNNTLTIPDDYGRNNYGFDYYVSNPIKLSDTKPLTEVDKINKTLETKYGIKSDIKNPELLKAIHSVVKDFCNINENDDLFKNGQYRLVLNEKPLRYKNFSKRSFQLNDDEFKISYNSNINNCIEKNNNETQTNYDNGLINTNNPNYYLYYDMAKFLVNTYPDLQLNFADGEENSICTLPNISVDDYGTNLRTIFLKLTHNTNMEEIPIRYIASKMCKVPMSKYIDNLIGNNLELKFPETNDKQIHVEEVSQKELKEIEKELKNTYGINVNFNGNTAYAKAILLSVKNLTKAANDNKIFNGLTIKLFNFGNKNNSGFCEEIENSGEFYVAFNSAFKDTKSLENIKQKTYAAGIVSTNNIVHTSVTHELAHWLQWNRPKKYHYNCVDKGIQFINKYNKDNNDVIDTKYNYNSMKQNSAVSLTLSAAAKVSAYATEDAGEFCSEYVAGRMDGKKYPKVTDELFETLWRGPKLNFPETDN